VGRGAPRVERRQGGVGSVGIIWACDSIVPHVRRKSVMDSLFSWLSAHVARRDRTARVRCRSTCPRAGYRQHMPVARSQSTPALPRWSRGRRQRRQKRARSTRNTVLDAGSVTRGLADRRMRQAGEDAEVRRRLSRLRLHAIQPGPGPSLRVGHCEHLRFPAPVHEHDRVREAREQRANHGVRGADRAAAETTLVISLSAGERVRPREQLRVEPRPPRRIPIGNLGQFGRLPPGRAGPRSPVRQSALNLGVRPSRGPGGYLLPRRGHAALAMERLSLPCAVHKNPKGPLLRRKPDRLSLPGQGHQCPSRTASGSLGDAPSARQGVASPGTRPVSDQATHAGAIGHGQ
jgi:hypothetical protein